MEKPYSPACERNREPILAVLRNVLAASSTVLEIGSGTGQHAVYFGGALPHLRWQTSDVPRHHAGIRAWLEEARLPNVLTPLTLDVARDAWPDGPFDAAYTANTCHIMAWDEVNAMLAGVGRLLRPGGVFCVYGPFNYGGRFTSVSNAQFDASLKMQAPHMGIRNMEDVLLVAGKCLLVPDADHEMPANNRLLVLRKRA